MGQAARSQQATITKCDTLLSSPYLYLLRELIKEFRLTKEGAEGTPVLNGLVTGLRRVEGGVVELTFANGTTIGINFFLSSKFFLSASQG